jgi:hypothetical protein
MFFVVLGSLPPTYLDELVLISMLTGSDVYIPSFPFPLNNFYSDRWAKLVYFPVA